MKAGQRDQLILIQHKTATEDDYGSEVEAWTDHAQEFAEYKPGTGAERRQAAQESASLAATFRVLDNPKTRAVTPGEYRISYDGAFWDITSAVRLGRDGRELTAVRSADGPQLVTA
jgi:SPP1 family predicted phage head-tail adaptor